jgi:hypothetical protein
VSTTVCWHKQAPDPTTIDLWPPTVVGQLGYAFRNQLCYMTFHMKCCLCGERLSRASNCLSVSHA